MSSFIDTTLSITPSDTLESTSASQSRKKSKKSAPVWDHTRYPLEDENTDFFYCSYCPLDGDKPPYDSDSSSNMTKHINRNHPIIVIEKKPNKKQEVVKEQLRALYSHAKGTENIEDFQFEALESVLNDEVVLDALIHLIVVRNLSYSYVEWLEFHTFCQALNKASGCLRRHNWTACPWATQFGCGVVRTIIRAPLTDY
jgi:hypothetical protein